MKLALKIVFSLIFILLVIVLSLVTTIDMTPYQQLPYYQEWEEKISGFEFQSEREDSIKVGWAKTNITPDKPMPMAGYGKRKGAPYTSVHDSIFVRTLVIGHETQKVALVAADLLIIPPTVTELVEQNKPENLDIYFGATHSHNSLGAWYNTLVGKLFAGQYDPEVEEFLAKQILQSIELAEKEMGVLESISYEKDLDENDIRNRLVKNGPIAPYIRSLRFKTDEKSALLSTYAAHSTVLNSATFELSRDYPGVLVDSLERTETDFALFMAGTVGSMGPIEKGVDDFDEVNNQAIGVLNQIKSENEREIQVETKSLSFGKIQLPLRKPSPRINTNWAMRPWVFKWLFGEAPADVKIFRVGQLLMIGLPCDFSGELMAELDEYAAEKGLELIITSFNGGYTGYITADEHFEKEAYETTTMNWFGPYNGAYFSEVVRDIIDKAAQAN
ncbi:hypothetical protein [Jiulongibacter sediminis]|jgi:hypothetical protein|uniref:hypothetical protein n=1 Tax=Jiulongibacter sediminis TaxID=1605367 RepID=UPI0026F180B3|nr:hypothetical protein [Jiulongibacter sediminis]